MLATKYGNPLHWMFHVEHLRRGAGIPLPNSCCAKVAAGAV